MVTFASSIHISATKYKMAKRRTKVQGSYRPLFVKQPLIVHNYNQHMSGVDHSDQYIGKYVTLRKAHCYWKTIFYHLLDVARVNSLILFNDHREKHPDIPQLQLPKAFRVKEDLVD